MYPVKKITKEDTWRSDDLKAHIQGHNEESRRRDRSKREEDPKKHRDGESLDRRHKDSDRDARREKEKQKDRESKREGSKHRDPYRDRTQDIKREEEKEDKYKEKRRERERENRHRDGEKEREDKRRDRGEKDSERQSDRKKDRYKEWDMEMYKQRDKDTEWDRENDRERERRRAERDRERKSERDRRKEEAREGETYLDRPRTEERVRDKEKERERERRERHRARESDHRQHEYEEKQTEGERRERRSDKEHRDREHRRDREDREKRRKHKESHEVDTSHSREAGTKDGQRDREKASEREERDRRRDRRHKEASESKRIDKERKHKESLGHEHNEKTIRDKRESTTRPQVTWRSVQAEMSDPEVPVENEETEEDKQSSKDYHDYEEDFEDYEEDFEDADEEEEKQTIHDDSVKEDKEELSPRRREEIKAIQRAIEEENERIYSARSKPTTTESAVIHRESHSNKGQKHGKIIDFISAKQREVNQKVAKKQKKRSEELLRLIDLDFSITFSLLDLPPVNEYDMYIKNFGTANTKQAYVQCNEDNTDRDIQTEEVDMTDKWTQHPAETKAACGGSTASQETADESIARMAIDSQRLTTFLRSATQVMAVLIEENLAESNSLRRLRSQTNMLSFSDGCLQLNTKLPFLHGRQVSLLQFSQVQRQTLLSVHPSSSKASAVRLDSETVICVWNMWEPSRPQKILLYESEVKCCCFSPGKATLVFAGTAVGSVVVWDLREHSATHYNLVIGQEEWTLRYPTFSTDAVLSGVGHLSSVVSVEPVLATAETSSNSTLTADIEESLGLSFQLGSLDENGVLTLWVVVELPKGNDSGSQTDLGLRPGGKVKLLHSSSLQTTERLSQDMIGCGPSVSLQLKFLPSDSSHYFIGTNMGLVRHGTRHSLKVLPKIYRSQSDSCRPVEVTALDFSPSGEPLFLVGCSDGTVRLHSVLKEDPLMEWSGGSAILSVQWCQTRSAVFCALDAASNLYIWDLTEKDSVPVISENIHHERVTAMAVFGEPAKQNTFSGVALAKQSGKVEILYFTRSLTLPKASDKEKLQSVLQDAF